MLTQHLLIANAYQSAFPDKILLARYPEHMPDPQAFGYSDGLFFTQSISGSEWDHGYFHNILKSYHSDQIWKRLPTGGEIDPCVQPTIWQNWPNLDDPQCNGTTQDVEACFNAIHPTWLFSHHVYTALPENSAEWDNAIRAQKLMGYTFYIDQYRLSSANGNPAIEVNIQNTGLAPMYANWELEFGALNASNEFQPLGFTKWSMDLIQPDVSNNYRSFISTTSLGDGTYTFLLRMVNPLESISPNAKAVRFANTSQDEDMDGWLTLGEMTISSGNAGSIPTKVSSLSVSPSSATMTVGDLLQLAATVAPTDASSQAITWVSDHPGTASVDTNGVISAGPAYGPVTISAYTQDGSLLATTDILVEPLRVPIPASIEAEAYIGMSGIAVLGLAGGGSKLGFIDRGDWMDYGVTVNTPSVFTVAIRASSLDGSEIRLVNESGDTLEAIQLARTTDWNSFTTNTSAPFSLPAGSYNLRLLASKAGFDLDWIEFKASTSKSVEWTNFKATPQIDNILLEWTTSFENNNDGFHIERGISTNNFTRIGWVDGKGSTNDLSNYSFTDSQVEINQDYFYRLAQQDISGALSYSGIVTARLNKGDINYSDSISVYPNPTNDIINIQWDSNLLISPFENVKLFNTIGVLVTPSVSDPGMIDLSSLPAGIYFLEIELKGDKVIKQVLKY